MQYAVCDSRYRNWDSKERTENTLRSFSVGENLSPLEIPPLSERLIFAGKRMLPHLVTMEVVGLGW